MIKKKISIALVPFIIGGLLCYFQFSKTEYYDIKLPIEFGPDAGEPRTNVKIEDSIYSFEIDLGASAFFWLSNDILQKINKVPSKDRILCKLNGEKYSVKSYIIPEIKVRNLIVNDAEVQETTPIFFLYNSPNTEKIVKERLGVIGRYTFETTNLFLDFKNSAAFVCSHLKNRKKDGYCLKNLSQVPFEISTEGVGGIIFQVDTDFGLKNFLFDTGTTANCIKASIVGDRACEEWKPGLPYYLSSKFKIGKKDFGEIPLILFNPAPVFKNCDGIIGMEFLKNHIVYLDFKKKIAYIGKSADCLKNS